MSTGYIPTIWYQVKVELITQPGTNSCTGPRDFGPTRLTSFLLKTMERSVDKYLRDGALTLRPLHSKQHIYKAGKSVEMALHQLVVLLRWHLTSRQQFWVFS
jgi:hypothetical protein